MKILELLSTDGIYTNLGLLLSEQLKRTYLREQIRVLSKIGRSFLVLSYSSLMRYKTVQTGQGKNTKYILPKQERKAPVRPVLLLFEKRIDLKEWPIDMIKRS